MYSKIDEFVSAHIAALFDTFPLQMMPMGRRRMTIDDVAELAGVSYQTVSRVINNRPDVRDTTRERVQKVIDDTGYKPSHIARSLATARTATIGLVVPDISNPFFAVIARGAEQVASEHGYTFLLSSTNEDVSREVEVLNMLDERYVDGVIVCGFRQEDESLRQALSQFDAVVLVNRRLEGESFPAVLVDDALGGYLVTRHLLDKGHTAVGFLAGPPNSFSRAGRLRGYRKALAEASVEPQEGWTKNCMPTSIHGRKAASQLLETHPELSAIFCYNDLVALGALRGCEALGRRVPADIAIAGFDDIMLAGVVSPALTTCHVPREEMGRLAASMLLDCINDQEESCSEIVIKPELIIRDST
ncbi:MAG: LacI family DNA-binding transcriptional regulator [Candidatus Promineifilaceae bacterium]